MLLAQFEGHIAAQIIITLTICFRLKKSINQVLFWPHTLKQTKEKNLRTPCESNGRKRKTKLLCKNEMGKTTNTCILVVHYCGYKSQWLDCIFAENKNKKQKAVEIHGIRHFIYVCIKRVSSLFFCGPADTTCASAIWADLVEVLPTYAPRDSFGNRLRLRHEKNVFNAQTVCTNIKKNSN